MENLCEVFIYIDQKQKCNADNGSLLFFSLSFFYYYCF